LALNRFACFPETDFSLDLRIFAVCAPPSPPILLGFPLHRWRFRVLDLTNAANVPSDKAS